MRILIHGLNFAPELTGIGKFTGELAEFLVARGHDVKVVCAPPYYPDWRIPKKYAGNGYVRERGRYGRVIRCPIYVPRQPSGLKRILHLVSFAVSSFIPVIAYSVRWKPDLILSMKPTIFGCPISILGARISRAIAWLHIQDMEIDAGIQLLQIGADSGFGSLVGHLERLLLSRFHRVSTISQPMMRGIRKKGVHPGRLVFFPNWVDVDTIFPFTGPNPLRERLGLPNDRLILLYSGNMGEKQGLEIVIEAAKCLVERPFLFLISGDGAAKRHLIQMASGLPNVRFIPLQPAEDLNHLLNLGDIHLLPQRPEAESLVMPSKLTGILAAGKPVVATLRKDSDLARFIDKAGIITPPFDVQVFVAAILELAGNEALRKGLGEAARKLALANFDKEKILGGFHKKVQTSVLSHQKIRFGK